MRKTSSTALLVTFALLLPSCSPRDFLTRRLAADLIAGSNTFRTPQQRQFRTGILSNQDYLSSNNLALQRHGWVAGAGVRCPSGMAAPCWDVTLTPAGVDAFQSLIAPGDAEKQSFSIPAAKRELVSITGIVKQGNIADVEFIWRWTPLNEVGAALYTNDSRYSSTVGFRCYDDGWRVMQAPSHSGQPLDEALHNAEPAP
jgi:hypothetical protein